MINYFIFVIVGFLFNELSINKIRHKLALKRASFVKLFGMPIID